MKKAKKPQNASDTGSITGTESENTPRVERVTSFSERKECVTSFPERGEFVTFFPERKEHVKSVPERGERRGGQSGCCHRSDSKICENREFQAWMSKYEALEQEIMTGRARREANRQKKRAARDQALSRAFGDFCEATGGRAVLWREEGFRSLDMMCEIASDVWTRQTAERYFQLLGRPLPGWPRFHHLAAEIILSFLLFSPDQGVIISYYALKRLVGAVTTLVRHLKLRAVRPLYYEQETARRRALAATRRQIRKRATLNPCPSKDVILEAYLHRKESKEAALYFGSLLHDLECFVDNSLQMSHGRITGRHEGIKGWLRKNIPVLADQYTTVMRYKAAAKKLRQLVELDDPIPTEVVLTGSFAPQNAATRTPDEGDETARQPHSSFEPFRPALLQDEKTLRAVAIYRELSAGVENATQMILKIDAFLDPDRVEEATMLAIWRERYQNEITVRNKSMWVRRMMG
jgi:hypothetical protein